MKLLRRLRALFRKEELDQDLSDELAFHLEKQIEQNVAAGMSAEDARYAALRSFGGVEQVKEECRNAWGLRFIDSLLQDIRFGLRMLAKNPGFTVVAVLTLALGIGAITAIFSVVNAVLLKPLLMADPSRVVYIQESMQGIFPNLSVGNFADIGRQSTSFTKLCASQDANFNLATLEAPERIQGEMVTRDYFATFGIQPIAGRVFTAEEDMPGRGQVVVISELLWRTRLHADPGIVGQPIRMNGIAYTVVGVMPKTFDPLLINSEVWIPEGFTAQKIADHDNHFLNVVARLKPGVSLVQAQSELNLIALRLQQQYPMDDKDRGFRLTPLTTALLGDRQPILQMILSAVGFVLLIACANIANLQLARARTRQKEMAVRAALGASPRRIVRQLLAENIVLGIASGALGVLLAYWGVAWIVAHGPAGIPRLDQASVDARTLGFACAVTLFASFLFGLAPALRSASTRFSAAFQDRGASSGVGRDRMRSVLVAGEVALALMLMTGAGLLIRSALLVSHLDPGFDTSNLIVGRVGLPEIGYHDPKVARQTFQRMITAAEALPGVHSVAIVSRAPLAGGGDSNGLIPEGKALDPANAIIAELQIVSPGYLSTARIPLRAGREFTAQDTRDKTLVTIVNETLARTAWPGENPIGKRFACCEPGPQGRMYSVWHEVVGVVGDVRAWGLDRQVRPEFYLPIAQMPPSAWDWIGRTMDLMVRTRDGRFPSGELRTTVASIAPGVPIYRLSSVRQKISGTLEESHFDTSLLAVFAAIALLLSSVGIYGVLSYVVAQRTRHIGIRMALGATRAQVMREVLWYGIRLTSIGLALGLGGAIAGTRVLSSLLYGVKPADPLTYSIVSLLLIAVALLAAYIPARRATKVDPMVALRNE
jgi:putative ABC transport system permease protein